MSDSEEDRNSKGTEPEPILHLPALGALERMARGETEAEGDLDEVWNALEALARLSPSGSEAADLAMINRTLTALESDVTVRQQESETDKGFREYDDYFHVVRLSDKPLRTFVQGLLTSYRSFLGQLVASHSVTPTERGILRSAIQNLAADLREDLKRKGEAK